VNHIPYAFDMCGEMLAEHSGRLFHLNIRWLIRKDAGESDPRNGSGALIKSTES